MNKCCWVLLLGLLTVGLQPLYANEIDNVRIRPAPDKTRIVFDLEQAAEFSYFTLYQAPPYRLVIDFPRTSLKFDLNSAGQSDLIKRIRTSTPKDKQSSRIVIELHDKLEVNLFPLTANDRYGERLVVDLLQGSKPATAMSSTTNAATTPTAPALSADQIQQRKVIIAIDAGHGGDDPGSIGPSGTYEKNVVLRVSRALADIINADPNMEAHLIRTGDYYVAHKRRVRKAEDLGADMLISVHADAFTSPQPRGGSVWVLSTRRANNEMGRLLEDKERLSEIYGGVQVAVEAEDTNGYLSQALVSMSMEHAMASGYEAAEHVVAEMERVTRMHKKKPQHASLAVLTSANITSMLVEIGFISNPQEEKLLLSNKHQQQIARAIYQGARRHFTRKPPDGTYFASNRSVTHTVRSGESLSVIAQRYRTSVKAIKEQNNLRSNVLKVGQILEIPAG